MLCEARGRVVACCDTHGSYDRKSALPQQQVDRARLHHMDIFQIIQTIIPLWLGTAFLVSGFRLQSLALKMLGMLYFAWILFELFIFTGYTEIAAIIFISMNWIYFLYIHKQKAFRDVLYGKLDIIRILFFQDARKK
jgi:uncharacterized BrkB/YihY/UPF0761 family membrane protein